MGILDKLFRRNRKDEVQVEEHRDHVFRDTAAAAAFAEAGEHDTARAMLQEADAQPTILMVGREDEFSNELIEYSVEMAKRLNFAITALNVTDVPLSLTGERRDRAVEEFQQSSAHHADKLQDLAAQNNIAFNHVAEVGKRAEVIQQLRGNNKGMRYVLSEPDPRVAVKAKGRVAIPVVDLGCYQGAAA